MASLPSHNFGLGMRLEWVLGTESHPQCTCMNQQYLAMRSVCPLYSCVCACVYTHDFILLISHYFKDVLVQAAVKLVNFADVLSAGERNPVNLTKIR